MTSDGTWTMFSADDFPADTGTLDVWYLRFNDEVFPTACDILPDDGNGPRTTLGHRPLGLAGENCHTITVGGQAADAHLNNHTHDVLGECSNDTAQHHGLVGEGRQSGGTTTLGRSAGQTTNGDEGISRPSLRRRLR